MNTLRITSWNVNSLNVRLNQVIEYLDHSPPQVLGLQELKQEETAINKQAFTDKGLFIETFGQKTYNGVALISHKPLQDVVRNNPLFPDTQSRLIAATVENWRIVNVYAPNGKTIDDEKYHYKLAWYAALHQYLTQELARYPQLVLIGDFNIAPNDIDVHDPKKWNDNSILCSTAEREALAKIQQLGLTDSFRHIHPTTQQFSWWDYRASGYRRNQGLRIDLCLARPAQSIVNAGIDYAPRENERPSDHAPAWVELGSIA